MNFNLGNLSYSDIEFMINETFPDLNFRKYQKKVIIHILLKYDKNPKTKIVLDAPTGAGKSIIAMVVSKILNKYFNKSGYIITSDTYLQDQYETSTESLNLDIPSVKGLDRYFCDVNLMTISLGQCKIDRLSDAERRNLDCYVTCPYYSVRDKAIMSKTSILNYNYWIIQQDINTSSKRDEGSLFERRDFVIFDEAHKVVNIVNNYFSPLIDKKIIEQVSDVLEWIFSWNKIKVDVKVDTIENLSRLVEVLLNDLSDDEYLTLKDMAKLLSVIMENEVFINSKFDEFRKNNTKLTSTEFRVLKFFKEITDVNLKLNEYINLIKDNPKELLIKTKNENSVRFYCFDESLMMAKFHQFYDFGLFMSATFLNHNFFSKYANLKDVEVIEIPSTFDYSKSPIYYNDNFNMSYKKKDENILKQIEYIDDIVDKYPSGVIHTGSYFNSETLINNSRHSKTKIKIYKNTEQKKYLLEQLIRDKNFFIAGPSLLEGVDLKDDISRCQIFMKIPFLSLGDKFVKLRSEKNFSWYMWETALNFVQGIGRSNRNETDYCDTYILDSTFNRLLNSKMIPSFIKDRIEYMS